PRGGRRLRKTAAMSTTLQSSSAAELVRAPLFVDVVSDVVCPWCYIGKRKLETALARWRADQPDLAATVRWHPFELNPDLPVEGIPRAAYLEQKFGGKARAVEIYTRVRAVGAEVGIPFDFDRISRQPNTRDAHRLIAWAQQRGDPGGDTLGALFAAQRMAFDAERNPSFAVRRDRLDRLAALVDANEAELVAAIAADFGVRPAQETRLAELFMVTAGIRHARRNLRRWMRSRSVPTPLYLRPGGSRIVRQPRGVAGVISPWN